MQAHGKITIIAAGVAFLFTACVGQAGVLLPEDNAFQANQIQEVQEPLEQTVELPEVFQWIYPDAAWSLPGSLTVSELMNPSLIPLVDSQVAGVRASSVSAARPNIRQMLPVTVIKAGPAPDRPPVIPEPGSMALGGAVLCGALAGVRLYRAKRRKA